VLTAHSLSPSVGLNGDNTTSNLPTAAPITFDEPSVTAPTLRQRQGSVVVANARKPRASRCCGPTSPEYSLKVAENRMREDSGSTTLVDGPARAGASESGPSLGIEQQQQEGEEEEEEDGDEEREREAGSDVSESGSDSDSTSGRTIEKLLRFRSVISKSELLRLLAVYQEVNGDFYPVFNMSRVKAHAKSLYEQPISADPSDRRARNLDDRLQAEGLIILNLAIVIALCAAEPDARGGTRKRIYSNIRDVLNAKIAAPATSIKHVAIAILAVSHSSQHVPGKPNVDNQQVTLCHVLTSLIQGCLLLLYPQTSSLVEHVRSSWSHAHRAGDFQRRESRLHARRRV
jgi:hypothetical protein